MILFFYNLYRKKNFAEVSKKSVVWYLSENNFVGLSK